SRKTPRSVELMEQFHGRVRQTRHGNCVIRGKSKKEPGRHVCCVEGAPRLQQKRPSIAETTPAARPAERRRRLETTCWSEDSYTARYSCRWRGAHAPRHRRPSRSTPARPPRRHRRPVLPCPFSPLL